MSRHSAYINEIFTPRGLSQLPGYVSIVSLDSRFIMTNASAREMMGFTSDDSLYGRAYSEMRCDASSCEDHYIQQDQLTIKSQSVVRVVTANHWSDGNWTALYGEKKLICDEQGQHAGLLHIFQELNSRYIPDLYQLITNSKKHTPRQSKHNLEFILSGEHILNPWGLTKRQQECLFLYSRGYSAKEIANVLNLSKRTIEEHVDSIKHKMQCTTRSQITEKSIAHGHINNIPESFFGR